MNEAIKEVADAIQIIVKKELESVTNIYTGVVKSLNPDGTCSVEISGNQYMVKYVGGVPAVDSLQKVFVPQNNMSRAFIIVPYSSGGGGGGAVDSVNGKTGTVVLNKSDIGLGNVDNVKQYSASNPPPYPVASVDGATGAVTTNAIKTTVQSLTDAQKQQARTNIGAGTSNFSGSYDDLTNKPTIPSPYTLPVASSTTLGGVKPATKTDEMTQSVGVDSQGLLYTIPGGGTSADEIFMCTFTKVGDTYTCDKTVEEIAQAKEAGKIPYAFDGNVYYPATIITSVIVRFENIAGIVVRGYIMQAWGAIIPLNITLQDTSQKVTTISSSSTDAQYPSAKCVWDTIPHPIAKTDEMTQSVGMAEDGGLYTAPGTEASDVVKYTQQSLTAEQQSVARNNIGAGTSNFSGNYNDLDNKPIIPDAYTLPIASNTQLGGVKPVTKTNTMTQSVGVDSAGRLWTSNSSSSTGGKRYARTVVAPSGNGWTEQDCDYLCTGTDDNTTIETALSETVGLGGGEVLLLAGTYNCTNTIALGGTMNVTLKGDNAILSNGSSSPIVFFGSNRCLNFILDGITFDCATINGTHVYSGVLLESVIKNCKIKIQDSGTSNMLEIDGALCQIIHNAVYSDGYTIGNLIDTSTLEQSIITNNIGNVAAGGNNIIENNLGG